MKNFSRNLIFANVFYADFVRTYFNELSFLYIFTRTSNEGWEE